MEFRSQYCDFIGMYQNVFDDPYTCDKIIEIFENYFTQGRYVGNRRESEGIPSHLKSDKFAFLNATTYDLEHGDDDLKPLVYETLQKCLDNYVDEYSILRDANIHGTWIKMQRTDPGEAYHLWHFENGDNSEMASRAITWAIFLNDLDDDDGGETEFLYQRRRVKPKKNSAILWPAGFTHTHRGNTVLGNKSKYILTGWICFNN